MNENNSTQHQIVKFSHFFYIFIFQLFFHDFSKITNNIFKDFLRDLLSIIYQVNFNRFIQSVKKYKNKSHTYLHQSI